jgi:ubiquinone/menaquinone biosynthesis C-methylase UbiE
MVSQIGNLEPDYSTGTAKKLNVIDVAGGTGDISMRILEKAKNTRFYKASKHKHR